MAQSRIEAQELFSKTICDICLLFNLYCLLLSLLFSCQVMSDSLQPQGLQHTSLPVPYHLPEFSQVHVHWIGDAIQPSHPLPPSFPFPSFNLSHHWHLLLWVSSLHQVAKVLKLQLQHQSFQCVFRLISLRIYWFDHLAVQGTLKSLLQHHNSKASVQCSAFFTVQFSHPYMTTGKTVALTMQSFVGKVMSLLFHLLSGLVIAFLPKSKHF